MSISISGASFNSDLNLISFYIEGYTGGTNENEFSYYQVSREDFSGQSQSPKVLYTIEDYAYDETLVDNTIKHNGNYRYIFKAFDDTDTELDSVQTNLIGVHLQSWVLKDIVSGIVDEYDQDKFVELFVDGDSPLEVRNREDQASFNPLGRKYPLVIKDQLVKGDRVPLTLQFLTHTEYDKFDVLRQKQIELYLHGPREQYEWYGMFASELRREIINDVDGYSIVTIDFIETGDIPSV